MDLVRRDMSCCACELLAPGVGEFLLSSIHFHMSVPSFLAFEMMLFIIFTVDSAFPFDLGWRGLAVTWYISHD